MASPVSPSGIGLRDSWVATFDLEVARDPDGESPNPLSPCTSRSPLLSAAAVAMNNADTSVRHRVGSHFAQAAELTTYGKLLQVARV